jgi:hypothetical protein
MDRSAPITLAGASADGYLRMHEAAIGQLRLRHLCSAMDEDLLAQLRHDATHAWRAGYTEWLGSCGPGGLADDIARVSVGWDWYQASAAGSLLRAGKDIRSNLMAVDDKGRDLGVERTVLALARGLLRLDWPGIVAAALPLSLPAGGARLH